MQWTYFIEWIDEVFRSGKGATAKWAGFIQSANLVYKSGDTLLGRIRILGFNFFQPLGFKAQRHLAMIAGTGAGKTTFLITLLGLHKGNAFVVDPKGQITKIIARRRGKGGDEIRGLGKDVAILDPYKIVEGHKRASWNALDEFERIEKREGKDAVVKYSMKMAEAIIPMRADEKPYFPETSRGFLQGLILHVYTTEPPEKRNLLRVADLATRGYYEYIQNDRAFAFLIKEMQINLAYNGAIAKAADTLAQTGRSHGDILSTFRIAMKFLDIPEVRDISTHSDFSLEDLKLGNLDLFICAPTGAIREELSNWFRLLTVTSLDLFEKIQGNLEKPCLFAIDEMPSLGHIEAVETSAPVMRSYGVRLLAISQDLEKLQKAYPKGWKGFLGNADAVYWMGTNENETASYLSETLGSKTHNKREGIIPFFRKVISSQTNELMDASKIKKFLNPRKNTMIVTRFGQSPMRVGSMPYYNELPVCFYDPDPEHKEASGRAWMRSQYMKESWKFEETVRYFWKEAVGERDKKIDISYDDAKNIFGIQEPFSMIDLNKRRNILDQSSQENPSYLAMISKAHDLLREKASL